jgi:hypothetical protein
MPTYPSEIEYSDKYMDDRFEYRHVLLPRVVTKKLLMLVGGDYYDIELLR